MSSVCDIARSLLLLHHLRLLRILLLLPLFPPHVTAQLVLQQELPLQLPTACNLLAATFPGSVAAVNHKEYDERQRSYWSARQADLRPTCRFYPTGNRDIQEAITDILIPYNVSIAVTSGGRSSIVGASNVHGGITIDLARFNSTSLVDHDEAVVIGAGARWGDVYKALATHKLTVVGSKVADDDVGGHVLGCGLSWFGHEHGFTCDGAIELSIVTPQGQHVWTNAHWNDDLFWASKGSLGTFGIVTQIKLPTIKERKVYGGITSHAAEHAPLLFEALQSLTVDANKDPAQSGYISFGWSGAKNKWSYNVFILNTEHQKQSRALDAFIHLPTLSSTLRTTTIRESAIEIAKSHTPGLRRSKFTLTARSSLTTMQALHDVIKAFTPKLDRSGQLLATYEPLTTQHLQASSSKSHNFYPHPNTFDISPAAGPLLLISVEFSWHDNTRDEHFELSAQKLRTFMQQELSHLRALHPFIYPAYAARDQDPFAALPQQTRALLKEVSRRYDPDGLWRKLVPGIWHV